MSVLRLTSTMSAVVLLLSVFTSPAIADQRVALVIGNASYAHAPVRESAGEALAFRVVLSRAAPRRLRVDYATSDGTATAGVDYVQTSGTLVFAAGDTAKTVIVTVLADRHDEREETLTLTLSRAHGGARITDGTATGTIEN